ncbi:MAG: hypothetical protein ACRBN8_36090 [Nannocystales bacterium]
MADISEPGSLADRLEPRGEIDAGVESDADFRLTVSIDLHRERALMLRVVVVVEVIVALVLVREAILLFLLPE